MHSRTDQPKQLAIHDLPGWAKDVLPVSIVELAMRSMDWTLEKRIDEMTSSAVIQDSKPPGRSDCSQNKYSRCGNACS